MSNIVLFVVNLITCLGDQISHQKVDHEISVLLLTSCAISGSLVHGTRPALQPWATEPAKLFLVILNIGLISEHYFLTKKRDYR